MKKWHKNMVAAGILLAVCVGIYANWMMTGADTAKDLVDTLNAEKVMSDQMLVLGDGDIQSGATDTLTDYFAAVRLSRQQARDSAVSILQEAMAYGDQSDVEVSNQKLEKIVQTALSEAQIESLVIAKGYRDCVAYMSDDGISVAVASPEGGLKGADVSVIADIVMTQSDYKMTEIRVVEVA